MTAASAAGTYEKPAGAMGDKTSEPWSATTLAAVGKKAQPGKATIVAGEIMDLSCYLQVGKHGEKTQTMRHAVLQNGQPIGLLTKSGLLADGEEHDPRCDSLTSLRQAAAEKFREDRGSYRQRDGVRQLQAIFVSGYVKK
jgi:hypothetical protein